jgi:hypothetical protein
MLLNEYLVSFFGSESSKNATLQTEQLRGQQMFDKLKPYLDVECQYIPYGIAASTSRC